LPPSGLEDAHPLHWAAVGDLARQFSLPRTQVCGELLRWRQSSGKTKDDAKKAPRELASRLRRITNSLRVNSAKVSMRRALVHLPARLAAALDAALSSGELSEALAKVIADKAALETAPEGVEQLGSGGEPKKVEVAEGEEKMEIDTEEGNAGAQAPTDALSEAVSEELGDEGGASPASPTDTAQVPEAEKDAPSQPTTEAPLDEQEDEEASHDSLDAEAQEESEGTAMPGVGAEAMEVDTGTDAAVANVDKAETPAQVLKLLDAVEIFGILTESAGELNGRKGKVIGILDGERLEVRYQAKNCFLPKIAHLKRCNVKKIE